MPRTILYLCFYLILCIYPTADAEEAVVRVGQDDFNLNCFKSEGGQLLLWVAPGFGTHGRALQTSSEIAKLGVEVCHVDLADNLFLTKSTTTMRSLDGEHLRQLIVALHTKTGKEITLITRSYGALPVLKAMRLWQLAQQQQNNAASYLRGAILFSPELYDSIPPLGEPPVFADIINANTMPLMIYQAGKRSNRWQLDQVIQRLSTHDAKIFFRVQQGVTGVFYNDDNAAETLDALKRMPQSIVRDIRLLSKLETPLNTVAIKKTVINTGTGLDTRLQPFTAEMMPRPLNLDIAQGGRLVKNQYTNQLTVINFWATWCPPCVEEIPSLNRLREKMAGEKFELISVNYSESREHVTAFLKQVKVDFPVLLDPAGDVSASWNVLVYPSTFVIGPEGKILYGVNGALEWDSDEILGRFRKILQRHSNKSSAN